MMEFLERLLTREGPWAAGAALLSWAIIRSFRWGAALFEELVKGTITNFLLPLKERGIRWFDAQQENIGANTETLYQIQSSLKEHDERVTKELAAIHKRLP